MIGPPFLWVLLCGCEVRAAAASYMKDLASTVLVVHVDQTPSQSCIDFLEDDDNGSSTPAFYTFH